MSNRLGSIAGFALGWALVGLPATTPAQEAAETPSGRPAPSPVAPSEAGEIKAFADLAGVSALGVNGSARLVEKEGRLRIEVQMAGLEPGRKHAVHVHEWGNCALPAEGSTGALFGPPGGGGRLGDLAADAAGVGHLAVTSDRLTLAAGERSVLGRALVVHAQEDELTAATGDSGAPVACGVILDPEGRAKPVLRESPPER
jgi:Cu-Zn family superoxide dismutase